MILATVAVVACTLNGDIPFQLTTEESNWQMPSYLTDGEAILAAIILGTFRAVLDSNKNKNKNENENTNKKYKSALGSEQQNNTKRFGLR